MILRHLHSRALGVAAVLAFTTEVGYGWLLRQQGTFEPGRVVMVAASILVLGLAGSVGAFTASAASRATLAAIVAGGLLPLGVLALTSIGLPLFVAEFLGLSASIAAQRANASMRTAIQAVAGLVLPLRSVRPGAWSPDGYEGLGGERKNPAP